MATVSRATLGLDIQNYSSPNSPSLIASNPPISFEEDSSPSPALWVNESPAELAVMLSDAYRLISDREKDLRLAAEIGKSLLENNIALKSKYDEAMSQSQQQLETIKEFKECDKLHRSIIQELELELILATQKIEELEKEQEHLVQSIIKPQEEFANKEKEKGLTLATEIGRSLLESNQDYKEIEFVKDLEKQNQELQQQIDETVKEYNDRENSNQSKICQLESDLQHSQDTYASATLKIEELEKEKERLSHREIELVQNLEKRSQELQQQLNETIKECNDREDLSKSKICKLESDLQHFQESCASATLRIEELEKENERLANEEIELIQDLKNKNQELQQQLDESIKERDDQVNSNKSEIHKLESDLQGSQDTCALAKLRIEELEKENERLINKEIELVQDLEKRNQELQQQLDVSIKECNDRDDSNKSKISELKSELQHFQDACALATLRIEELEKENERLLQKKKVGLKHKQKPNENYVVLKFSNSSVYGDPQKILFVQK